MQLNKNLLTIILLVIIFLLLIVLLKKYGKILGHNGKKHIRNHNMDMAEIEVNNKYNRINIFGEFESPYHHYGHHRPEGHRHHFYEELHEEL